MTAEAPREQDRKDVGWDQEADRVALCDVMVIDALGEGGKLRVRRITPDKWINRSQEWQETSEAMSGKESESYTFHQRIGFDSQPASGMLSLTVPGGQGTQLTVQVRVVGEALKRSHMAKVRRYLEIAEEDLENGSSE